MASGATRACRWPGPAKAVHRARRTEAATESARVATVIVIDTGTMLPEGTSALQAGPAGVSAGGAQHGAGEGRELGSGVGGPSL